MSSIEQRWGGGEEIKLKGCKSYEIPFGLASLGAGMGSGGAKTITLERCYLLLYSFSQAWSFPEANM